MSYLTIENIRKTFQQKGNGSVEALSNISFSIEEGEIIALIGPTGCGKTTLLRIIAGLDTNYSGSVMLQKTLIQKPSPHITMMSQQNALFPWLTVRDNIAFSLSVKKISKKERFRRIQPLIELVGLQGFEKAYPHTLSGGMQQRVSLARALAFNSPILLLDEPFGALDERTRHALQQELLTIQKETGKTIILVTHAIDEAIFLADTIIVLRDRPGSVAKELSLSTPHPRDRCSPQFMQYHIDIRELLEKILISANKKELQR